MKEPRLLINVGEPAGIGPDLCVALAQHDLPPLVLIGDLDCLHNKRIEIADNLGIALFIGMNAVRSIQRWNHRHSVEEKWHKEDSMLFRKLWIDAVELADIDGPEIPDHLHADKNSGDTLLLQSGKDFIDILARYGRIKPAQPVIGSGFNNDDVGFL